jgi:hypothetical protein
VGGTGDPSEQLVGDVEPAAEAEEGGGDHLTARHLVLGDEADQHVEIATDAREDAPGDAADVEAVGAEAPGEDVCERSIAELGGVVVLSEA